MNLRASSASARPEPIEGRTPGPPHLGTLALRVGVHVVVSGLLLAVLVCGPTRAEAQEVARTRPNFVFILADDLGAMDVRAYNPDTFYETPHLNRLALDGMRFTNAYAASPVCSPTRFSIMTGRYPSRTDATDWFTGTRTARFAPAPLQDRMPRSEGTLAEALKPAGYRTMFVGKWHLGPTAEYWPRAQGFDVNVGGNDRGSPRSYFSPYDNPELVDGPEGEYLTERLVDEALGLLDAFRDGRYKLIERFEDGRVQLYDLDADPAEATDIAGRTPSVVGRLRERPHAWYAEVDAKFLAPLAGGPAPWRP